MTLGAQAEEFEAVSNGGEAVSVGDSPLDFRRKIFADLHHHRVAGADQVMVNAIVPFGGQLKPGHAIAKIKAFATGGDKKYRPLAIARRTEEKHGGKTISSTTSGERA